MRAILLCAALLLGIPLAAAQTKQASPSQTEKKCGLQTYQDSLDLAFRQATAGHGETLVTLEVLASFQREYALVVKQEGSELKLFRATFRDQLWRQLGPLQNNKTRQECLDQAKRADMDTVPVCVSAEQVNSLWTAFNNTNLQTDTCARRKHECALIADGTQYVIQLPNGRSFRLTELEGLKGIVSENRALLDWVHTVIRVAEGQETAVIP